MSTTTDDLRIIIRAETERAISEIKKARESVDTFGKSATDAAVSMAKKGLAVAGVAMSLGQLANQMRQNIALYQQQEQVEAKLEAILRATGESAGFNSEQLKEMARSLQSITTFGDEAIINMQSVLLTFKSIQGEVFERTTELALDLSAAFGQDLQSSAMQLGKALEDPITGISALARVGVSFSNEQKELIRSLTETGRVAEAQGVILDTLAGQVGGVAVAMAQTSTGSLNQFSNAWTDLRESLGGITVDFLEPFVRWAADAVTKVDDFIKKTAEAQKVRGQLADGNIEQIENLNLAYHEQLAIIEDLKLTYDMLAMDGVNQQILTTAQNRIKAAEQQLYYIQVEFEQRELGLFQLEKEAVIAEELLELERQRAQEAADRAATEARNQAALQEWLAKVNTAYGVTTEGRREALQAELDWFRAQQENAKLTAHMFPAIIEHYEQAIARLDGLTDAEERNMRQRDYVQGLIDREIQRQEDLNAVKLAYIELAELEALSRSGDLSEDNERLTLLLSIKEEMEKILGLTEDTKDKTKEIPEHIQVWMDRLKLTQQEAELIYQSIQNIGSAFESIAADMVGDFFDNLAQSGDVMNSAAQAAQKFAQSLLSDIGRMAISAGLRVIATGNIPVGLALLALGGVAIGTSSIWKSATGDANVDKGPAARIINAEAELARERIKIIQEQLRQERDLRRDNIRKLEADYNREFAILKDMLDRNLISHDQFREQASDLANQKDQRVGNEQRAIQTAEAEAEKQKLEQELAIARAEKIAQLNAAIRNNKDIRSGYNFWNDAFGKKRRAVDEEISRLQSRIKTAQSAKTVNAVWAAAKGADFVTNGPQMMLVGDNPGGKERVRIEPYNSPNLYGPKSADGQTIININGPVFDYADLKRKLDSAGVVLRSRGREVVRA